MRDAVISLLEALEQAWPILLPMLGALWYLRKGYNRLVIISNGWEDVAKAGKTVGLLDERQRTIREHQRDHQTHIENLYEHSRHLAETLAGIAGQMKVVSQNCELRHAIMTSDVASLRKDSQE